ncbi:hypothetical protein BC826DRAFT_1003439, partial [Russula brevipes]
MIAGAGEREQRRCVGGRLARGRSCRCPRDTTRSPARAKSIPSVRTQLLPISNPSTTHARGCHCTICV